MSNNNPSVRFFFNDWERDQCLRLCSLAAQGLWMRLLCIAARHKPMGYVAINGRALTAREIGRLVGLSEVEVTPLLDELKENGVYSVDRHKRIYNRRMVKATKSHENGKRSEVGSDLVNDPSVVCTIPATHRKQKRKGNLGGQIPSGIVDLCGEVDSYKKESKKKGALLSSDWQPKPKHFELAISLGRDERFVTICAANMRDWCEANAHRDVARKISWDAAFSMWLRRQAERAGPSRPQPPRQARLSFSDIAMGALNEPEDPINGKRTH